MSRVIVSPDQIPLAEDFLDGQKMPMLDVGALISGITGGQPVADGMACTPTQPASMAVYLSPGYVLWPTVVDGIAFGVLPADLRPCMKVGAYDGATIPLAGPTAPGQQVVFLLEATFTEQDAVPQVEEYYNAANPSMPFSGPGNNGAVQYTRRMSRASVQLKPGAPAAAGQAVAPGCDPGWVPLWLVTVEYGATGIVAGNIAAAPGAPRFTARLTSPPSDLSGYATHAEVATEGQERTAADGTLSQSLTAEAAARTTADTALEAHIDGLRLGFRNQTVLTVSGPFVVPAGISVVKSTTVGGGGGGGASNGSTGGGGGGAGGTATVYVGVTPGQSVPVTVGAFGAGGQGGNDGGSGGSSSFGPYASGSGGAGGSGGNSGGSGSGGGDGFGNGLNAKGGFGGDSSAGLTRGGDGGASSMGGGGRASNGAVSVENGQAWGSGGGGGYGNAGNAGGSGQQGIVVIEY